MYKKFNYLFSFTLVFGCLCVLNTPASAVTTLTANDAGNTSSFNNAQNWSDGLAPYAGNTYNTTGYLLRSPVVGGSYQSGNWTFAGDSLRVGIGAGQGASADGFLTNGGVNNNSLIAKANGVRLIVDDLILDAGYIRDGLGSAEAWTIDGNIFVTSNGGGFACQCRFDVDSVISGSGTLYIADNGNGETARTIYINSGSNTYYGNIQLTPQSGQGAARCRLTFSDNSRMNFVIGASGVNNSISGTGTLTLSGDFNFDLTGASTTIGDSWTIVSASSPTFSDTFTVIGFTDIDGILWMKSANGVNYQFSESTGILSVVPAYTKAYHPIPVNGGTVTSTSTTLRWSPGAYADKHDIYIGTDVNAVSNATEASHPGVTFIYRQDPNTLAVSGLTPGETHYWRVDEVNSAPDYTIFQGDTWSFNVRPVKASNPNPADGATFVDPNADLSWIAGAEAAEHKVYMGTTHPLPLVSTQTTTTYDPNQMAFGTIYYWRIDEINDSNTWAGDEWQFTTQPLYVDANGGVGGNTVNDDDGDPDNWQTAVTASDDLWARRALGNDPNYNIGTVFPADIFEASGAVPSNYTEDCMPLRTTITNLTPGEKYDISVVYWSAGGTQNWCIWAGFDLDNLHFFDRLGQEGAAPGTPTGKTQADRTEYTGLIGRISADGSGQIKVYIDDKPATSYIDRTWYDGLFVSPAALNASNPSPRDGAINVEFGVELTWEPGAKAQSHLVYFDPNIAKVQARQGCDVNGVSTGTASYSPSSLETLTTYYWAIDEVNGAEKWLGNVWRFTIRDYSIIDDFESYTSTGFPRAAGTLRNTWIDGYYGVTFPSSLPLDSTDGKSGSFVQLASDTNDGTTNTASPAFDGGASMKFYYDNDGTITWLYDLYGYDPYYSYVAPMYSEAIAAIVDAGRLSTSHESRRLLTDFSGYKLLRVPYYGDPTNTVVASDKLYVTLRDADGTEVTVSNPDQTIIQNAGWDYWYIKLSSFAANPNLDLTNIVRIYVGIGNKSSPTSGGRGAIFLDEIKLLSEGVCIPGSVKGDFDNDCTVDNDDLQRMTELWLGRMPTMPNPVIRLDASVLTVGNPVTSWTNTGTAGGAFEDFNVTNATDSPTVAMVEGKKAVVFDGNDILRATINAPASIIGNNPWTVIYTVWNLEISSEEIVFTWAKRGTTARYAAVGYGNHVTWGAVAHWDAPYDMGFDRGVPAAHTWHTIGVTYQGDANNVEETIVVDGIVNAAETKTLNIWPSNPMVIGGTYEGNPDDVNNPTITPLDGRFFSGAVSKIEVYDVYTPPGDLALLMGTPVNLKNDSVIDFKDVAILANKWLVGPILFGN